ncbi:hypothetical protein QRX50_35175 [Amycolatopsis carbonis]|uniref:Uncharacterized protein n=1 Tax=Amycolatopsis carbonis TaxID=715471 RepID=A0A9Y2IB52_9PSEU|nr:hypothetical protein [Amycolatopsis sp. 2-15]WIX76664.1 hypothetical protein QRX50_35175 [Amycolatopsis sp. 2-15]
MFKLSAMAVPDAVEQLRLQLVDPLPRPELTELLIEPDWSSTTPLRRCRWAERPTSLRT